MEEMKQTSARKILASILAAWNLKEMAGVLSELSELGEDVPYFGIPEIDTYLTTKVSRVGTSHLIKLPDGGKVDVEIRIRVKE